MNEERVLDISWATILKVSVALLCFYVLYLVRDLLLLFLFALVISLLLDPVIDFLQKKKVPRNIAVLFIYFILFGLIAFSVSAAVKFFIGEIQDFLLFFPQYFEKIAPPLNDLGMEAFRDMQSFISAFSKTLEKMADNIFNALFAIFGDIFSTFFVFSIAIFLSLEEKVVEKILISLSPKKYEGYILSLWDRCEQKVSGWFGVKILGSIFVGLASYLAFRIFGVSYPFSLALMAGVLDFIPVIGPLIAGTIAFMIVAGSNVVMAIFVVLFFILIQLIEGNIITPILTKKLVGLPPVLVLISLAVGGSLWGIMGAILVIPLAGILYEFLRDFLRKRKEEEMAGQ
ncbi:MAG: AI-2E family transporter [bacterium]